MILRDSADCISAVGSFLEDRGHCSDPGWETRFLLRHPDKLPPPNMDEINY